LKIQSDLETPIFWPLRFWNI